MKNQKGFTLVEMLITVAIISILSMIAVPAYVGQQKNATRSEAYQNVSSLRLLQEQLFSETAAYAGDAADVDAIKTLFPGFKPGNDLKFKYVILADREITKTSPFETGISDGCFVAGATGDDGTRVKGEVYGIDCNGVKNF